MLLPEPGRVKARILNALKYQFSDGSTLHNFFKITEWGEKTNHSDTPLWIPFGITEYLNETGLQDARVQMPRAHAVARAQMNIRALHSLKIQMRQNDWIVPSGRDDRQRMLWQITPKAQKLLDSSLLDLDRTFQYKSAY